MAAAARPGAARAENLKVLFDLRPALDGHAGIPQEARLLFASLRQAPELEVCGLLQGGSSELAGAAAGQTLAHPPAAGRRLLQAGWSAARLTVAALRGRAWPLQDLPTQGAEDWLWQRLFSKSVPLQHRLQVTLGPFQTLAPSRLATHGLGLVTGALGHPLFAPLDTAGAHVLIAQTPYPARLPRSTRLVVRYFDAIPVTLPETVRHRRLHRAMHLNALYRNAADGAWFACASDATRADLLALLPEVEGRSFTIPCMLSHAFHPVPADGGRVAALLGRPPGELPPFLLMVSTLEPRKNHLALIEAWERLRGQGHADLHLVLVGNLGWQYQAVLQRMQPGLRLGCLHHLSGLDVADLRLLYRHASVTVAPSLGEGFDFAGVESMRCGGIVAASDIPVHRGVFADAAVYFPARDPVALARTVHELLAPAAQSERQRLQAAGKRVAAQYLPAAVLPQWLHWLERIAA